MLKWRSPYLSGFTLISQRKIRTCNSAVNTKAHHHLSKVKNDIVKCSSIHLPCSAALERMASLTGTQIFITACEIVPCNDWCAIWLTQLLQKLGPPWLPILIRFGVEILQLHYQNKWSWQRCGGRCLTFLTGSLV